MLLYLVWPEREKILDRTVHPLKTANYEYSQIRSNEPDGQLAEGVQEVSPNLSSANCSKVSKAKVEKVV